MNLPPHALKAGIQPLVSTPTHRYIKTPVDQLPFCLYAHANTHTEVGMLKCEGNLQPISPHPFNRLTSALRVKRTVIT